MQNEENNLFIGSLSFDTTDDTLREHFESVGEVRSAKVIFDKNTGHSRGFGFVMMETPEGMQAAIEQLNETELDNREIRVSEARPRER